MKPYTYPCQGGAGGSPGSRTASVPVEPAFIPPALTKRGVVGDSGGVSPLNGTPLLGRPFSGTAGDAGSGLALRAAATALPDAPSASGAFVTEWTEAAEGPHLVGGDVNPIGRAPNRIRNHSGRPTHLPLATLGRSGLGFALP